jgi:branched-chain amino acid transport system substrate-binding protein
MSFRRRAAVVSALFMSGCAIFAGLPSIAAASSGLTASAPGVTPTTITIGLLTSLTGDASSSFSASTQGALARIDWQNAHGGVDGRKLVLVTGDDQSSAQEDIEAAQKLNEVDHAFGVVAMAAYQGGGISYLNKQKVPIVGFSTDGYEWFEKPNTNMFTYEPNQVNIQGNTSYAYTVFAKEFEKLGVTKLAELGYGTSESSSGGMKALAVSAKKVGLANCYENTSITFGSTNFTADALSIRSAGCNGAMSSFVTSSDIALSSALKQDGWTGTQILSSTGYTATTQDSPSALAALTGDYITTPEYFTESIPAVKTMYESLEKYVPGYKKGIPDFGLINAYISTDLMIKGLEVAGKNPTRSSFIDNLRKVKDYDAQGMLPSAISFTGFGTSAMFPKTECEYLIKVTSSGYTPYGGSLASAKFCGTLIKVNG